MSRLKVRGNLSEKIRVRKYISSLELEFSHVSDDKEQEFVPRGRNQ